MVSQALHLKPELPRAVLIRMRGYRSDIAKEYYMTTVSSKNQWHSTACGLCYINCGIEAMTEGRQIVKVRGNRAHPATKGYACQKPQRLNYYQNHADRLTTPLRKRSDGSFEAIDWDTCAPQKFHPLCTGHRVSLPRQ
jgi:anaerobic selenocysteine-containing dehydrogenase